MFYFKDIKSIGVSAENHTLAVGFSNGIISIIDSRTGNILSNWKAHENEISHVIIIFYY